MTQEKQRDEGRWQSPPSSSPWSTGAPQAAERIQDGASFDGSPTMEEFDEARNRELARLVRISSLTSETLPAEHWELLEHDTPQLAAEDRETVRCWSAARHAERRGAC